MRILQVVGVAATIIGVIVGNLGSSQMVDAFEKRAGDEHGMFSTGEQIEAKSGEATRAAAVKQYQEEQPDGPLYQRLKLGQVLVVVGVLIVVISAII